MADKKIAFEEPQIVTEAPSDIKASDDVSCPTSPTGSEGGELISSDGGATGQESLTEQDHMETLSDDMSDTGWDTDLEIEGKGRLQKVAFLVQRLHDARIGSKSIPTLLKCRHCSMC